MTTRNIALLLEYDGTRYHGWQRQKNALSIQQVLEEALTRLTGEGVRLIASGRTDAGVHALGQVANFHTAGALPLKAFEAASTPCCPGISWFWRRVRSPRSFTPGNRPSPRLTNTASSTGPAVPPCIAMSAGGFQGSWIWRP